jgi:hypothetical protein
MFHGFQVEIAKEYGVDVAVMVNHFDFWLTHNKANGKNIYEGKVWTYNSIQAMCDIFPYWTVNQIRRSLEKMLSGGVLEKGNHNQVKYDRTTWYTFTNAFCENHKCILQFCQMEVAKTTNGLGESHEPIPVNNQVGTQVNKQKKGNVILSFPEGMPENYKNEILIFIEHRKEMKKPMTQRALDMIVKKLEPFTPEERTTAINNAIISLWSDVFPQKKKDKYGKEVPASRPSTILQFRPTHCDICGKELVDGRCICGRRIFLENGKYIFEDAFDRSDIHELR